MTEEELHVCCMSKAYVIDNCQRELGDFRKDRVDLAVVELMVGFPISKDR